jgi:hypothetical protein
LCATYASNHLFVSTDPAAARPAWLLSTLPFAPANRDGIACPEAYSCVIAGYDVSASSDLGNDPPVWTTPAPTPSVNVIGRGGEVTCVTATACVVFGDGELDVGTGTPAPAPSDAAITATLDGLLTPHGPFTTGAAIAQLHGYAFLANALTPGTLRIRWTAKPKRRTEVVASVPAAFTAPVARALTLRVTRAGARLLRSRRRVAVTVTASFTPTGGTAVRARRTVTVPSATHHAAPRMRRQIWGGAERLRPEHRNADSISHATSRAWQSTRRTMQPPRSLRSGPRAFSS